MKEALFQGFEYPPEPWTKEDGEKLKATLEMPAVRKALAVIYRERTGLLAQLLTANLGDPAVAMAAAKVQGVAQGMTRMVEGLVDLALAEEETADE